MDWNEETILRLRGLWAEGHSTAEIGRRLGVTKNAVVGKAHRLDLPARPSPIRRDATPGAQPRRPALRRVAGPTLPPWGSTTDAAEPVSAQRSAPATIANVPSPVNDTVAPVLVSLPQASRPEPSRPEIARPETARPVISQPVPQVAKPVPVAVQRPSPIAVPPPAARLSAAMRPVGRSLTCCWPIGEPGTKSFRFCDEGATAGKPYCATHAAVAYVKVRDRREDAA